MMNRETVKKAFPYVRIIALLASVCMLAVAVTFAWFMNEDYANIDKITQNVVKIENNGTLIFDEERNDWFSKVTIPDAEKVSFKPLSGNGQVFFQRDTQAVDIAEGDYSIKVPSGYKQLESNSLYEYVSMDFKMKNNMNAELYIGENTRLISGSGNVSELVDFAAGAMRVSLSHRKGDSYVTTFVWVPNATYDISANTVSGEPEEGYVFRHGTDESATTVLYPTDNGQADGQRLKAGMQKINGVIYLWGDLKDIAELSTTPITTCKGGVAEDFRLTIWLEGTDRECTNAVIGGAVNFVLKFETKVDYTATTDTNSVKE